MSDTGAALVAENSTVSTGGAPHLIIVAYAMAPGSGGAEGIVNARLVRALARHWPSGVSVISDGGPPSLEGIDVSARPEVVFHIANGGIPGLRDRRSLRYRCVNRAFFELTGEGLKGQCWMRFAARALQTELARHPDAVVYSRALPYTSIEAVRRVRQNRIFRWIVNFNDPLPPDIWPGQYSIEPKSCQAMRKSLNGAAALVDAITFPCAQLRALQLQAFETLRRVPSALLPHLPADRPEAQAGTNRRDYLTIAYAGTLRRGNLTAEFAAALTEFAHREPALAGRVRLSFCLTQPGPSTLEFIRSLPFRTTVSVDLPPEQCDEALSTADVLLDVTSDVWGPLLTTKIATYVGLDRPVWAVCKPGGTAWNLVQRGWGYASDVNSRESVYQTLRQIATDWAAGQLWRRSSQVVAERFAPERQIADLIALCRRISAPESSVRASHDADYSTSDWP